ncbi:MAG: helicase [Myxococcales bacterium]|nr:helicase [Myxococcales bacterium]
MNENLTSITRNEPPQNSSFEQLGLIEPIARAVHDEGYTQPTPIQTAAIPHVLEGRDLLGLAQTGTGKTAAFALPILQRLAKSGRRPQGDRSIGVLVLTPTRELASQIGDSFGAYGKHLGFRHTVIFGGVGQNAQEKALRQGIDILVATPGRLLDLVTQRIVHLSRIEIFVLDEADRMLDMGFVHDVRRVLALLPKKKQSLFFSATMPPAAQALADDLLHDPATVAVNPVSSTVELITQFVYFVEKNDKRSLLTDILSDHKIKRALVFSRTKHGADRVVRYLDHAGIKCDAIHGNKSQNNRERALARFKAGESRVLVATDIAARGIDIDDITHVVNFDLPNVPETYVHRIGRTARAGASGVALSFCDAEERGFLRDIERLIGRKIDVIKEHAFHSTERERAPVPQQQQRGPRQQQQQRGRQQPQRAGGQQQRSRQPAREQPQGGDAAEQPRKRATGPGGGRAFSSSRGRRNRPR